MRRPRLTGIGAFPGAPRLSPPKPQSLLPLPAPPGPFQHCGWPATAVYLRREGRPGSREAVKDSAKRWPGTATTCPLASRVSTVFTCLIAESEEEYFQR